MPNNRSKLAYWIISISLASGLLYWSLRGIEWAQVGRTLSRAHPSDISICACLITGALFLRAVRWRVLLRAEGNVSVPDAYWATAAGYFGNNFLPARAGEIVRTVMISARANLGKAFVLTTALSERMVDAITLVVISACVLFAIPEKPKWLADASLPFAIIGFGGVVAIAVLPYLEGFCLRVTKSLPFPVTFRTKLEHVTMQILLGVRSFHDFQRLFRFLGFTVVIWLSDALCTVICARALDLTIPLPIAFLLITGLGLGSALPSTPGYVGVYQFVAVSVLSPFGYSRNDSIAYILLYQALSYVVIGIWGSFALWRSRGYRTEPAVATTA